MDLKRHIFIALSFVLLSIAIVSSVIVSKKVSQRKSYQIDLAEFQHVRYGLLNPHAWKRKVSDIINQRLDKLDFENMDKTEIRAQIIKALNRLFAEVEKIMTQKKAEGNWLERTLRTAVMDVAIDFESYKKKIPELADSIIEELDTPEARDNLKAYIQNKIATMVDQSVGEEDTRILDVLKSKYACDVPEQCQAMLALDIKQNNREIALMSFVEVLSILLVFLFWYLLRDQVFQSWQWYFLFVGLIILLYSGLNTPMIHIDARIDEIKINLLNSDLVFTDQILFFQSKSIMDVVQILIKNGDLQTLMVGLLILLFSIIFPLLKLGSTLAINLNNTLSKQRILHFLAYRTSKWSMADVFVVAIFMAYIGFRGILSSELNHLKSASSKADIIATDHSSLQIGIVFFSAFVILSILFAKLSAYKNNPEIKITPSGEEKWIA